MATLRGVESGHLKQYGAIRFGGGLDVRNAVAEAKAAGWHVVICDGYAALYRKQA